MGWEIGIVFHGQMDRDCVPWAGGWDCVPWAWDRDCDMVEMVLFYVAYNLFNSLPFPRPAIGLNMEDINVFLIRRG